MENVLTPTFLIGVLTTVVAAVLSLLVFNRYRLRGRGVHLLLWGTGLALYFVAGLSETILAFGWNDLAFRLWYWTGALVIPPILGQGTIHLLVRRPYVAPISTIIVLTLAAASLVWVLSIPLNAAAFVPGGDVARFLTESYREILPRSPVRSVLSPLMNGWGTLALVGGAIYSAVLFFRKEIMPNRVIGNIFIATGGLIPALGGAMMRWATTVPELSEIAAATKYVGILGGLVLLFVGFQFAVGGAPQPRPAPQAA
ncbi:MAG: hypothetical protein RMM31_01970 [Anaerolineae bacterium]|nr:hypothetical protein [Thermoflexales bacterium]MDW8394989.1 hypothetical protein [Anaerolineae bacterium]